MTQYDHVKTTQNTLIINLDVEVLYKGDYNDIKNADWIARQHKDIITDIENTISNVNKAEIEDVEGR